MYVQAKYLQIDNISTKKNNAFDDPYPAPLTDHIFSILYYGTCPYQCVNWQKENPNKPKEPINTTKESYYSQKERLDQINISFVISMIFLDRWEKTKLNNVITKDNLHTLFTTAFILSQKMYFDCHYSARKIAQCSQMFFLRLKYLEDIFLRDLQFDLFITQETYEEKISEITKKIEDF